MPHYRVTDRTTPKIKGSLYAPGSVVLLHKQHDYLVIDQLMETKSIELMPEKENPGRQKPPAKRARKPGATTQRYTSKQAPKRGTE